MKTTTKIALGVCAAGLLLSSKKANAMSSTPAGQIIVPSTDMGDPEWGNKVVGSSSQLIKDVGCFATATVAAANGLKGRTMRVDDGIALMLSKGGFVGVLLNLQPAAAALGCFAPDSRRLRNSRNIVELRARLDDTLAKGGVGLVHVDYDLSTPLSNHFIVCFGRDSSGYKCMDPAGGKYITLDANLFVQRTSKRTYTATGVAPMFASA